MAKKTNAIVASAAEIKVGDRKEAQALRSVRAVWQSDAFMYRDSLPEVRFATEFSANCAMRMRVFVGVRTEDGEDSTVTPTDVTNKALGVPQAIIEVAENAVKALTNQTRDFSGLQRNLSVNLGLAGEAYVLGITDPETHLTTWSFRSVNEITVYNDTIKLREGPVGPGSPNAFTELDPANTFLCRVWIPDPQYAKKADSQMKAIANECETLLILRRGIRSKGRSRLSRNAMLLMPSELSFAQATDGRSGTTKGDPFSTKVMESMMTPIADEGSASSVVPIIIRGAAQYLKEVRYVDMNSDFDQWAADTRKETVTNVATGMDLPAQITLGAADVNHWSLFLIDEGTFKYHIEPQQIAMMRCYTEGFLVPFFKASLSADVEGRALLDEWLPRLTMWYDPTDLLSHPDKSKNALDAFDRMEISGMALRAALGFKETDKPDALEIESRMIRIVRSLPANLLIELYHQLNPLMSIPAISTPGTVPGIGTDGKLFNAPLLSPGTTDATGATDTTAAPAAPSDSPLPNIADSAIVAAAESLLESASPRVRAALNMTLMSEMSRRGFRLESAKPSPSDESKRLSRQLAAIDTDLRAKIITAANAEMMTKLSKAGTRLRQSARTNEFTNKLVKGIDNTLVAQRLGRAKVEMIGMTAAGLMDGNYGNLEGNFKAWTKEAQERALTIVAQLAGIDEDTARRQAQVGMSAGVNDGWEVLKDALDKIGQVALYNPHPNADELTTLAGLDSDALVPTGLVRVALAVAGGAHTQDFGMVTTKMGIEVPAVPLGNTVPFSGVATGTTFQQVLTDNGCQKREYEWQHGPTSKPYEPHLDLDGLTFTDFTDDALKNDTDFPANQYFFPGDHNGCLCDANCLWVTADDVAAARANAGVAPVEGVNTMDTVDA